MKRTYRIVTFILLIAIFCGLFSGCSGVSENSDYITKGQYYALFIEENGLYSDVYSDEDIMNNETYELEAKVMQEWELIDGQQAENLDDAVTKELVAQTCVRFMAFRQEHTVKIKDIKKCHDQQAIMDAVGMGIFELSNGYFDANTKMTYEECVVAFDKTDEVVRNTEYDNQLDIEYQDDVESFSGAEILNITVVEEKEPTVESLDRANSAPAFIPLSTGSKSNMQITMLANSEGSNIKVEIFKLEYDNNRTKYQKGKIIFYDAYDQSIKRDFVYTYDSFAGEIVDVQIQGLKVILIVAPCPLNRLVKDTDGINDPATTYSVPMPQDYQPDLSTQDAKEGLDLNKTESGKGVIATFKHTFTLEDPIYTKQEWRNAKAKPSITITATVDNFKITTKNLGKLLLEDKKATADIKVTFDTTVQVDAVAGGLRYSPANNGNSKVLSAFKNSRWTGASAGGSKEIKLGNATIPLGTTGFSINCEFYMYVTMDGEIHVKIDQVNSYTCSVKKGEKPAVKNSSESPSLDTFELNANIQAGIHVKPNVKFWSFKIVDASAKAGINLDAKAGIYEEHKDEPLKDNVYATHEELEEISDYMYCIHTTVKFEVEGVLLTTDSVIGKFVINVLECKTPSIAKSWSLYSSHFEDGKYMSSCSRKNVGAVEMNSDGKIYLDSYKETLNQEGEVSVSITSVPISDSKISKNGGVTIENGNKKIAKATYDEETKTISIKAVGEGSTEITVKIKKSKKDKKYYKQKISVTVSKGVEDVTNTSVMPLEEFNAQTVFL